MERFALVLVLAAGCGRLGFDTADLATGDGAADSPADLAIDGVAEANLVAWYPMEQLTIVNAVGAVNDATGHGHDGSCVLNECPLPIADARGNVLQFDGVDDRIDVPSTAELTPTTGLTVVAWVRVGTANTVRECPTTKGLGSGIWNSWAICVEPSQQILFYTVTAGTQDFLTSTATLPLGEWHDVAITWDATQKQVWLDGVSIAQDPLTALEFDDDPVHIGADIDTGAEVAQFAGMIDDLRIYDRALTVDELTALAQ